MKYFFSPSLKSIYPEELKSVYVKAKSWPTDLIEIPETAAKIFIESSSPVGKVLGCVDNLPAWIDCIMTQETLIHQEFLWVDTELDRARDELEKVQDSDPKAVGSVSAWREYRKALRVWQNDNNFPNKELRPHAPDA